MPRFADRADAGRQLAKRLEFLAGRTDVVVLGLPRGGVPVAFEVASALGAPLDVVLVRKLGLPFRPEVAMGAIGEGGVRVIDAETIRRAGVTTAEVAEVEDRERHELARRSHRYRAGRSSEILAGRTVVLVDDGVATGSTTRAACSVVRAQGADRIIVAVPVAPSDWVTRFGDEADEFVCLETPHDFYGVGQAYRDFDQTSDTEVTECLDLARGPAAQES